MNIRKIRRQSNETGQKKEKKTRNELRGGGLLKEIMIFILQDSRPLLPLLPAVGKFAAGREGSSLQGRDNVMRVGRQ